MQTNYKTLADAGDLKGKKVLLRLDLNVPIVDGKVRDDFRIKQSLPTLAKLKELGARVIVLAHLESEEKVSLKCVSDYIQSSFTNTFVEDIDTLKNVVNTMQDGDIVILENLRVNKGEKANDELFAKTLASLGDIYVNDAFSVSHRAHASIVGIPKYLPSYAGPLLDKEITELSSVFNPEHPFLFILGGAKFDTKLPLIEKFLGIADYLFIGGALANDIYKVRGLETGISLLSDSNIDLRPISSNQKVIVPSDVVVQDKITKDVNDVSVSDKILDAGSATIAEMVDVLHEVKYVLWNGPLGDYENGYSEGTELLARAIAESGVRSIVGGGDTVAVIRNANLLDKFSFVSTGGGAMLDFLAKGTLVGVEALKRR